MRTVEEAMRIPSGEGADIMLFPRQLTVGRRKQEEGGLRRVLCTTVLIVGVSMSSPRYAESPLSITTMLPGNSLGWIPQVLSRRFVVLTPDCSGYGGPQ